VNGEPDDLLVRARSALLDALTALAEHRDSVVVIGAQAIYLHTGLAPVAVAEATKDSDLAIDTRSLADDPLIEAAMAQARFYLDPTKEQPGAWMNPSGIPVDLMVPKSIAGRHGRRSVDAPPHVKESMRWANGLEATVVDHSIMEISALSQDDPRRIAANVAGPAGLLVAKLHKIAERQNQPSRLLDKDAYDIYRLLIAVEIEPLRASLARLLDDPLAGEVTAAALEYLLSLFAVGPEAVGSVMAGRTEEGIGDPAVVAASCSALASDLLAMLGRQP
jgi:hypothetical protein